MIIFIQWCLLWICGTSMFMKAYYHFLLYKKKNGLELDFWSFYFNPFSHFFAKMLIYFPFYLFKKAEEKEEHQRLRKLILTFSWIGFILFVVLGVWAINQDSQYFE